MVSLFLSAVLAAGGLDDAKAALQKLEAKEPVRAQLKVMRWQRNKGGEKPVESSSGATFQVGEAQGRVSMSCTSGMLNDSNQAIVQTTTLTRVKRLLDAREDLLDRLGRSTLISEEAVEWKGQPARLLKLDPGKEVKSDRIPAGVTVEARGQSMRLWLDANGLPLASDSSGEYEGGFMMIRVKRKSRFQREFAVVDGRLVMTRETEETSSEGAGGDQQLKQTAELTVRAEGRGPSAE